MGGFKFYKWVLSGSAAIMALLLGSAILYKLCGRSSQSQGSSAGKVENNFQNKIENNFAMPIPPQNTMPNCPLPTTAHRGTNPLHINPPPYIDPEMLEIQKANQAKRKWLAQLNSSD